MSPSRVSASLGAFCRSDLLAVNSRDWPGFWIGHFSLNLMLLSFYGSSNCKNVSKHTRFFFRMWSLEYSEISDSKVVEYIPRQLKGILSIEEIIFICEKAENKRFLSSRSPLWQMHSCPHPVLTFWPNVTVCVWFSFSWKLFCLLIKHLDSHYRNLL